MKRLVIALLCASSAGTHAQDRADIDRTQIVGNRELPKVLYIVPWKKPLPGVLAGRPVNSVLDEALAPIDRAVFRREVSYSAQVQARTDAATATATPPSLAGTTTAGTAPVTAPITNLVRNNLQPP